ncbi:hypothetical protein RhiLY_01729 [Ceratobasidium sp. AG-Ba]|nr:hypothetical protein RhiLY_01729 [Ceratobasidium sp. AG-Ba]
MLGGYVITYQEAATYTRELGIEWSPLNPTSTIGCRLELNRWMIDQDSLLWYFRLQPIFFDEADQRGKLIFPTIGIVKGNYGPDYRLSEDQHTTPIFRDIARRAGLPDKLFSNFVTVHDPVTAFVTEEYGHPKDYSTVASRTWMAMYRKRVGLD